LSQTIIKVEGMSCSHCKAAVEKALKEISGVEEVQVNLDDKEVVVSGNASREQLAKAIEEAGYDVVS